jgi:uncharacterized protein with HEPN domain
MTRGDNDRLLDILSATTEVQEIIAEDLSAAANQNVKLRALERLLEIIGEATSRLSEQTTSQMPQVKWRLIKNSRVMLAHEYFRISGNQVFDIARTDVPLLQNAVRELLERA